MGPLLDLVRPEVVREAEDAHRDPPRAYHHFGHVRAVLDDLTSVQLGSPVDVALAALFHDAVYVPSRGDNEQKSAELAREVLSRLPVDGAEPSRVARLIQLTALHGKVTPADLDGDLDAALFLDADMAILGASRPAFDAYDAAIAEEYRDAVPSFIFSFNRRRFLRRLLDSPRIYLSEHFHRRLDRQARANIAHALDAL